MLGLQYMYKTGYDPASFVDFFEKIEALEKKKHGAVAELFSSHPMTEDRIAGGPKEHPGEPGSPSGIRGEHFGIQRRQGPAGHD